MKLVPHRLLAALLVAGLCPAVFAAAPTTATRQEVAGTIASIDAAAKSFRLTVTSKKDPTRTTDMQLRWSSDSKLMWAVHNHPQVPGEEARAATEADLKAGAAVVVFTEPDPDGKLVATEIWLKQD